MKITLNNQEHIVTEGTTLLQFMEKQKLQSENIAVAINNKIVLRTHWADNILCEGDKIVVVAAAYGG